MITLIEAIQQQKRIYTRRGHVVNYVSFRRSDTSPWKELFFTLFKNGKISGSWVSYSRYGTKKRYRDEPDPKETDLVWEGHPAYESLFKDAWCGQHKPYIDLWKEMGYVKTADLIKKAEEEDL